MNAWILFLIASFALAGSKRWSGRASSRFGPMVQMLFLSAAATYFLYTSR